MEFLLRDEVLVRTPWLKKGIPTRATEAGRLTEIFSSPTGSSSLTLQAHLPLCTKTPAVSAHSLVSSRFYRSLLDPYPQIVFIPALNSRRHSLGTHSPLGPEMQVGYLPSLTSPQLLQIQYPNLCSRNSAVPSPHSLSPFSGR